MAFPCKIKPHNGFWWLKTLNKSHWDGRRGEPSLYEFNFFSAFLKMRLFEITSFLHTHQAKKERRWKMMTFDKTAESFRLKRAFFGILFANIQYSVVGGFKNNNNMRWQNLPDYDKETVRFFSCWSCITIKVLPPHSQLQSEGFYGE